MQSPAQVPHDTVVFVADSVNRCKFWICVTKLWAIQMDCAPGSRLKRTYIGGSANPCAVRYFNNDANNSACLRPPAIATVRECHHMPLRLSSELRSQWTAFRAECQLALI